MVQESQVVNDSDSDQQIPWQLKMFSKTLKKQQRLKQLRSLLGTIPEHLRCLLVTCGDNNGAINWHLREIGGQWTWADIEEKSIAEMSLLLGEPVQQVQFAQLPFKDGEFDIVVTIDVHEHLSDPQPFMREIERIVVKDGRVLVTVPGGEPHKLVNVIKNSIGMTKEEYGHARDGYSLTDLRKLLKSVDLIPERERTFSRFFTELVELMLNFVYVKKLAKKSKTKVEKGTIAPATSDQLKSVEKTYRIYSMIFPLVWMFSRLDLLILFTRGYVMVIEGRKRQ